MYKIGEFAKLSNVTARMLRYYDKCGILGPEYVDRYNGNRYYDLSQMECLFKIRALLSMGFNVDEIKKILESEDMEGMILSKRKRFQQDITNIQEKMDLLDIYGKTIYEPKDQLCYWHETRDFCAAGGISTVLWGTREEALQVGMEMAMEKNSKKEDCFSIYLDNDSGEKKGWKVFVPCVISDIPDHWNKDILKAGKKAVFMFLGRIEQIGKLYKAASMWEEKMNYTNPKGIYEEYYCCRENLEFMKFGTILMELRVHIMEQKKEITI